MLVNGKQPPVRSLKQKQSSLLQVALQNVARSIYSALIYTFVCADSLTSSYQTAITRPSPLPEPRPEHEDETENEGDSEVENTQTNPLTEQADLIVPVLEETDQPVLVREQYANTEEDTVSAFAKIAGKSWTYYVKESSIIIGRSAEAPSKSIDNLHNTDAGKTHIDLYPVKHVSRVHAKIFYNSNVERWHVEVYGRNGLKVNDLLIRRGHDRQLNSGDVLEVAGFEMIFVSPDVPAVVHEKYLDRLKPSDKKAIGNDWNEQPHGHPLLKVEPRSIQYQPPTHISPYAPPGSTNQAQAAVALPQPIARPVTPPNPLMSAPYLSQNAIATPTYNQNQPVVMESNEKPDYSSDANKSLKPPMSYATLIGQAILSGEGEKKSLNGIYEWIKEHFSYYRHIEQSWQVRNLLNQTMSVVDVLTSSQNSIRHNLSLNEAFDKCPRAAHEPGKGGMWYIKEEKKEEFKVNGLKMTSRGGARRSSNPNSPVPKKSPKKKNSPGGGPKPSHAHPKSPSADTPLLSSHASTMPENQTPSRPPRSIGHHNGLQTLPQLSDDASPLPRHAPYLSQNAANAGSPPMLTSSAFLGDQGSSYNYLTPAPQRHEPRLTVPSTVKLPSYYLPQSSPNPWWNQPAPHADGDKNLDTSPIKQKIDGNAIPPSSSPPPPSPTRPKRVLDERINGGKVIPAPPPAPRQPSPEQDEEIDLMG